MRRFRKGRLPLETQGKCLSPETIWWNVKKTVNWPDWQRCTLSCWRLRCDANRRASGSQCDAESVGRTSKNPKQLRSFRQTIQRNLKRTKDVNWDNQSVSQSAFTVWFICAAHIHTVGCEASIWDELLRSPCIDDRRLNVFHPFGLFGLWIGSHHKTSTARRAHREAVSNGDLRACAVINLKKKISNKRTLSPQIIHQNSQSLTEAVQKSPKNNSSQFWLNWSVPVCLSLYLSKVRLRETVQSEW